MDRHGSVGVTFLVEKGYRLLSFLFFGARRCPIFFLPDADATGTVVVCQLVNPRPYFGRFIESENRRNMKFLTFEQIKQQLRLDDEQAELERTRLESIAEAAEDAVLTIIRRPLYNVKQVYGHIPQKLIQVTLLLVDEWYQHRSPVEQGQLSPVPYAFDFMLKPMMRLAGEELPLDPVVLYLADFYGHRIKSSNGKFIVTRRQFY